MKRILFCLVLTSIYPLAYSKPDTISILRYCENFLTLNYKEISIYITDTCATIEYFYLKKQSFLDNKIEYLHFHEQNPNNIISLDKKTISIDSLNKIMDIVEAIKETYTKDLLVIADCQCHYIIKDDENVYVAKNIGCHLNWMRKLIRVCRIDFAYYYTYIKNNELFFYSLDGLLLPYDKIKDLLSAQDVKRVATDSNFAEDKGLCKINTKLLIVYNGNLLKSTRQKRKTLSGLDFNFLSFRVLKPEIAKKLYGTNGKNGAIIISQRNNTFKK